PANHTTSRTAQPSPWRGFFLRSLLYAGGVAGGAAFGSATTSSTQEVCTTGGAGQDCVLRTTTEPTNKSTGMAIAGASIGIGLIDALITASKTKSTDHADATPLDRIRTSVASGGRTTVSVVA